MKALLSGNGHETSGSVRSLSARPAAKRRFLPAGLARHHLRPLHGAHASHGRGPSRAPCAASARHAYPTRLAPPRRWAWSRGLPSRQSARTRSLTCQAQEEHSTASATRDGRRQRPRPEGRRPPRSKPSPPGERRLLTDPQRPRDRSPRSLRALAASRSPANRRRLQPMRLPIPIRRAVRSDGSAAAFQAAGRWCDPGTALSPHQTSLITSTPNAPPARHAGWSQTSTHPRQGVLTRPRTLCRQTV